MDDTEKRLEGITGRSGDDLVEYVNKLIQADSRPIILSATVIVRITAEGKPILESYSNVPRSPGYLRLMADTLMELAGRYHRMAGALMVESQQSVKGAGVPEDKEDTKDDDSI